MYKRKIIDIMCICYDPVVFVILSDILKFDVVKSLCVCLSDTVQLDTFMHWFVCE